MRSAKRFAVLWVAVTLLILVLPVNAQDDITFQQGDRVIVLPDVLPVRTGTDETHPIVTELWGGMVTRVVAVVSSEAGETWVYLENNAYGWVPAKISGQFTLALFSEAALDQMLAETNAALSSDPNAVSAYLRRGTISLSREDYAAAVSDYSQAIELAPDETRLYEYLGKAFLDRGDGVQAELNFQRVIDAGTVLPGVLNRMSISYQLQDRWGLAREYIVRAQNLVPEWGLVNASAAFIFSHYDDMTSDTLTYYSWAIERDPYYVGALHLRAQFYQDQGDIEAALDDLNLAIEIDPFYVGAYLRRGIIMSNEYGDTEAALADFNYAIGLDPTDDRVYAARGLNYLRRGETELGINDLKQALALNPNNENAAHNLAYVFGLEARYTESLAIYTSLLQADLYDHFTSLLYRAMVYIALGQYELALTDVDQFLTDTSMRADFVTVAYLLRGAIDLYKRQYAMALADYSMGFMAYPEFVTDYGTYGQGYWIAPGHLQDAEAVRSQLSNTAADADIYEQMGAIYMEFGQWEAALDVYRQALALRPNADLEAFVNQFEIFIR
ncbi:MAG: tetratricopeptide repeat protein [Chloroflexi bacterium]|nr:tetratricopeptide repeat protein [Chloroflexota bacterium]